uniref:Uncharacterized protein n=1 Tax=viral metagenome TaxID=1070528 RepID=A0A6M3KNR4_9ZZZZ
MVILGGNTSWLSAKNCKDGDMIEFLNAGDWVQSTRFKYDDGNPVNQLVFKVKHEGEEKQLTLIKGSREAMIGAFGSDTLEWVGHKAKISLALNTKGTKSILLTPIGNTEPKEKSVDVDEDFSTEGEDSIPF